MERAIRSLEALLAELRDPAAARRTDALRGQLAQARTPEGLVAVLECARLTLERAWVAWVGHPTLAPRSNAEQRSRGGMLAAMELAVVRSVEERVRRAWERFLRGLRKELKAHLDAALARSESLRGTESERAVDHELRSLIRARFSTWIETLRPAAEAVARSQALDRLRWIERARRDARRATGQSPDRRAVVAGGGSGGEPGMAALPAFPRFEVALAFWETPLLRWGWLALVPERHARPCIVRALRARLPAYVERLRRALVTAARAGAEHFSGEVVRSCEVAARLERTQLELTGGAGASASRLESGYKVAELRAEIHRLQGELAEASDHAPR